ncbi:MAG: iron chaperone [Solirubrobacteraceae bacterium]
MSIEQVDAYLAAVEEPKRSTLEAVRHTIMEIMPDAEQTISYKVPAFRADGAVIAGFAAFRDHLSYLPFSGSVLTRLAGELTDYTMTKSALHFSIDRPLPRALVEKLIAVRRAEVDRRGR